ncbi:MAG TPA: UbiX family flavin prenyltransferase [Pyrodictium delaneyi]|uniref:Flavin prenyltransferase UbiX n=1 Tax=Pyrodictium delaneyi TaxID=1273541 RepID=A0A832ZTY8_9CREN|nr:UbiX family flavin prenyltransferase [Pyrodictium delaneyi]
MSQYSSRKKILVGITGASGVVYGIKLAEMLHAIGLLEAIVYTRSADHVAREEMGVALTDLLKAMNTRIYRDDEIDAPYASSSRIPLGGMVVAPCSMRTLAAIAHGIADNLVTRAALSTLRLQRRLVLVVRETPLGVAELRNMLLAAENGAVVLPASPAFYHQPKTIDDMVRFIVGKVFDVLGIEHSLYHKWRSGDQDSDIPGKPPTKLERRL